jgi:hypothetical protein
MNGSPIYNAIAQGAEPLALLHRRKPIWIGTGPTSVSVQGRNQSGPCAQYGPMNRYMAV